MNEPVESAENLPCHVAFRGALEDLWKVCGIVWNAKVESLAIVRQCPQNVFNNFGLE